MFVNTRSLLSSIAPYGLAGLLVVTALVANTGTQLAHAAMDTVMTEGSNGPDVQELQSRLGFLGYYHGMLNGNFGWETYWAVRDFQYAFGLPVDGTAGLPTIAMLRKATTNWSASNTPQTATAPANSGASAQTGSVAPTPTTPVGTSTGGFSANDINLMAHVVYGEARGQPFIGQVAVAAVILNRYHSDLFPHSIPAIIYQPGAFTSVSNGQAWLGLHKENTEAVMDAINGYDPAHGALYYWNPATATSSWVWSQPIMLTIGQHVFAK